MEQPHRISYHLARFHRRAFGNVLDFFVFALAFLGLFLGVRGIVSATPAFMENEMALLRIRKDSGLYYVEGSHSEIIVDHLDNGTYSAYVKMTQCDEAIKTFIAYLGENISSDAKNTVSQDYDTYRLSETFTYNLDGVIEPYFVRDETMTIVRNEKLIGVVNNQTYYERVYAPYVDERALGYLVTLVPRYLDYVRVESTLLFALELPVAWVIAGFLVYFVPGLFWRRGRQTFGKWTYHIGLADKRLLSCSLPRFLARFAIFFFGELTLSIFTFGIPCLVSTTLMAFSKQHQGFPDYLLGLNEVDTGTNRLYFSFEEIELLGVAESKQPVDFHPHVGD